MANKVSCRSGSGRTKLIDPNSFQGQSSSSNIPVQLEDLNISIQLETYKKGRSVLKASSDDKSSESNKTLRVTFIEGETLPSGKKALTTKFTDLTTVFEADNPNNDNQDLGISSIDIDFNSSYAPLVTINFIDVRGSAIFQNENNLKEGKNKYATFFELPYPLYQLTIKGYYGKPVKYCLHMTKFNSKFNSQTGNFEITASFIGYTYAMLSDMLIGYLKAIPYTEQGKIVYQDINKIRQNNGLKEVPYLNEFIAKLSKIDEAIKKISADSAASKKIEEIDEKLSVLTEIEQTITQFGSRIEENSFQFNIKEKYPIILGPDVVVKTEELADTDKASKSADYDLMKLPESDYIPETETRYKPNGIDKAIIDGTISVEDKNAIKAAEDKYESDIKKLVEKYNSIGGETNLDFNKFSAVSPEHFFRGLTKNQFDENLRTADTDKNLRDILKPAPDSNSNDGYTVFEFKVKQYSDILFTDYVDLAGEQAFSLYDMTYAYESISFNKDILNSNRERYLIELASQIDVKIANELGVKPTIRNVVEVFTVAVEAFMKTLFRISNSAEGNQGRKTLLNKIFGSNVKSSSDLVTNDTIFAWPDYTEKTELGYVEKYLGSVSEINKSAIKVDELEFINNLLEAFITGEKKANDAISDLDKIYKNWIPVNPLDTKIFINESPYERLKGDNSVVNKVLAMMLTRAMTFLNYSNKNLTEPEILQMSTFEANLISKLPDANLKSVIANKPVEDILKTTVDINNLSVSVLKSSGTDYYYNMLFDGNSDSQKLIPISYKNPDGWEKNKEYTLGQTNNYFNSGSLYFSKPDTFLTNYSSNQTDDEDRPYVKFNDGGLYVQILSKSQYEKPKLDLVEEVITESVILLDKIKVQSEEEIQALSNNLASAGFNTFGGIYGIQEFSNMNFGNSEDLNGLPLMYVFYGDYLKNGLAYKDQYTIETTFKYPLDNSPVNIILDNSKIINRKDDFGNFSKNRKQFNQIITNSTNSRVGYPFVIYETKSESNDINITTSLFGTRWYYSQTSDFVRAMLFLNTLPFNNTKIGDITNVSIEAPEIARLFDQKSGFIKAPRLWCAFIGSILWRYESGEFDVIDWKDEGNVFLFPKMNNNNSIPKTNEYIKYIDVSNSADYQKISEKLLNLPTQVSEEFKRVFFDFVTGSDANFYTSWPTLKNKLEIWDGSGLEFKNKLVSLNTFTSSGSIPKEQFSGFKNLENYNIATILHDATNYMFLELYGNYSDNSRVNANEPSVPKLIIDAMMEEVVIANNDYKIWGTNIVNGGEYTPINVNSEILTTYINNIKSILAAKYENPTTERKNTEQQIFGTTNEDVIKLQLYRTCKNIYDKWIGGVTNESELLYQCGFDNQSGRRNSDTELSNRLKTNNDSLISSFRFVSRSFADIGDKFYINPLPIVDVVKNNPNASFYDIVSRTLADNNFDFIALPTYIDYSNDEELSNIFEPFPKYEEAVQNGICGPSFVCVYVGQTSKNLDFNDDGNSYYSNDGFDIRCIDDAIIDADLPVDFKNSINAYEDPVSVFAVNFGQQNQNIFKDITLDQSEFAETAESLKIIDDISTKGSQNNVSLAGQNLYNVYSVRSYKAEVEMMGDAMIQPMMYFQLNNIPMFHGAYMITHVKHAIKPNYMSTHFTGVRIKKSETPLLTAADLYMSFLDSLGIVSTSTGIQSSNNYITDYYNDLVIQQSISPITDRVENYIGVVTTEEQLTEYLRVYDTINNTVELEKQNWENGNLDEQEGVVFLDKYAEATPGFSGEDFASNATPWSAAFLSYIMLKIDPNFPKSARHYDYVTAAMKGENGYEAFPLKAGLKIYPDIGDIFCKKRPGSYTYSHCDVLYDYEDIEGGPVGLSRCLLIGGNLSNSIGFNNTIKTTYDYDSDYAFSFIDNKSVEDYQIIIKKTNNKYYGGKNLINKRFELGESSSAYPTGPSADYWSLVAVCSLENDTDQGRCDVAQSIYNRLLSGIYDAKSIKELIIAEKQYEPVGRAMFEFRQTNSKETAIKAFIKSKDCSYETAKSAIEATETALNNPTLVADSKSFIGGRTDFYSNVLKDREPYKTNLAKSGIATVERDNQIFGCFVGPGSINYGKKNPPAADKPDFSGVVS